jgi:EAL domain-containing protein (putative c-di-GMP-specific phosphodiesterase class I)
MNADRDFDLRRAIDAGCLDLYFQPRVNAEGAGIVGAEALLRWTPDGTTWTSVHCLGELDSEEFGLLWRWTMDRLTDVIRKLRQHGWAPTQLRPDFFISLNLSQRQLATDEWARELMLMLKQSEVPGACIEVEITEQGALFDYVAASSALEMLRSAGVQIALDDFPEGGASFLLLSRLRFDKVKIDRCMVPTQDEAVSIWLKKRNVLEDLLMIIARTGAGAVLEGVESPVQHRFLAPLAIDEWQGYLWGKPMPLNNLLEVLPFADANSLGVAQANA